MQDPKAAVTVHGNVVSFYMSPRDKAPVEIKAPNNKQARYAAKDIRAARSGQQIDGETRLYAAIALWAWVGTSDLEDSSWASYRPAALRICQKSGSRLLGKADKAWYKRWHEHLDEQQALISHVQMSETVLGSFATWCVESNSYDGPRPTGTNHRKLHTKYRELARKRSGLHGKRIKLTACPTLAEALRFGQVLGECAVKRWGPEYACWEHAPLIQFSIGCRFGELPVLTAENFDLDDLDDAKVWIFFQYRNGEREPGQPNTGLTKDKRTRWARIRHKAAVRLTPIVAEARTRPGQLLLPIPPHLKSGKRQLRSLYETAQDVYEERYGVEAYDSHWYRRAYVSWNRAPVERGGFDATDREVADWIGHYKTDLIQGTYDRIVPEPRHLSHDPGELPAGAGGAP